MAASSRSRMDDQKRQFGLRTRRVYETRGPRWRTRAISPLVGTLLLLAITVCLVGVIAVTFTTWSVEPPATGAFELSADGGTGELTIEHVAGDTIDVRELSVTVAVDGTELEYQPSVPFVGDEGFHETPTGPFNAESDPEWHAGERAGLTVAGTNDPDLESTDAVTVTLVVDGQLLAELEAKAT